MEFLCLILVFKINKSPPFNKESLIHDHGDSAESGIFKKVVSEIADTSLHRAYRAMARQEEQPFAGSST